MLEEQSSRSLKPLLLAFLVVALGALTFVLLTQRGMFGKKTASVMTSPSQVTETAPSPEPAPLAPPSAPLTQDDQKQLSTIQDQINAGTLSSEEALKQIKTINDRLQAEVKK